jgi:hypothetical protein
LEQNILDQVLLKVFTKAGEDYRSELKQITSEKAWVSFSVDELNDADYLAIRDHFLTKYHVNDDLHLDKIGFTADWKAEDIFERCFENLLEWVGMEIAFQAKKPETLLEEFKERLNKQPLAVTFVPLFRLNASNGYNMKRPLQLGSGVQLYQPNLVERELLKRQYISIRDSNGEAPGFHNLAPSFVIRVSRGLTPTAEGGTNPGDRVDEFKTLMAGLFGISLDTPFYFEGIQSAWHQWESQGARLFNYDSSREIRNFLQIDDYQIEAIENHLEKIGSKHLRHFTVTSTRLNLAGKRESALDEIIDYAVAIEGLFQSSEPTVKMCSAMAYLLAEDPVKRIETYEMFKEFFQFRGEIVHGKSLARSSGGTGTYKDMTRDQIKKHLRHISDCVRGALKVLLLNPELYNQKSLAHFLLGEKREVVRDIYAYRQTTPKNA